MLKNKWIAGGINIKNIKNIMKDIRPQLIDLNSGIEKNPGIKDPKLLKEFLKK